jgi:hypothetical protein
MIDAFLWGQPARVKHLKFLVRLYSGLLKKLLIDSILHLLDDFLLVSPSYDTCAVRLKRFLDFCAIIGTPVRV